MGDYRHVIGKDFRADVAGAAHRSEMPEQSETGDVGRGVCETSFANLAANLVEL